MLLSILVKRLRLIPVAPNGLATIKKKLVFMSELAGLGYEVLDHEKFEDGILGQYSEILSVLKEMRGGDVEYVPLFQGFPDQVPDQHEYFCKRIIGYIGNMAESFVAVNAEGKGYLVEGQPIFQEGRKLDNGFRIPAWLFELEEFGADPISQFQDESLYEKGKQRQKNRKKDTHVQWIQLRLVDKEEAERQLKQYLSQILYAKSSIKEELKKEIAFLLDYVGIAHIEEAKVVFKETKAYLMNYLWEKADYETLAPYIQTPTDLLRLFAANMNCDISLAEAILFPPFSRKERRFVLEMIEKHHAPVEDMVKYKRLWVNIGTYLHPGEYAKKYPKAFTAFDQLRNGTVITFNSMVEALVEEKNIRVLVELLKKRPGVFGRRLHEVLTIASEQEYDIVLAGFQEIAPQLALKNLLVLEAYFRTIGKLAYRTIINKKGRIRVMYNDPRRVPASILVAAREKIELAIKENIYAGKASWTGKKVWIDKALTRYTVPLQQRKASDGLMTLGRGSNIPLVEGKVLRLFVYWKEKGRTTDLDLSVIQYDEEMNYVGHVSYTNLQSGGIIHSGDLQSAPHGAAEFVDIDLEIFCKKIKNPKRHGLHPVKNWRKKKKHQKSVRYIATQIYKYSGSSFPDLDCYAGWMIRDRVDNSYQSFDIQTVQNKFDVNGRGSYAIPILIDLVERTIIFVDLYVNAIASTNNVEGAYRDISVLSRELARMIETRPNMYDLARWNVQGRSACIINKKEEADMIIGVDEGEYQVQQIEKILSELI